MNLFLLPDFCDGPDLVALRCNLRDRVIRAKVVGMITIRKSGERGHADHGWLDTYHTFSFAGYRDPRWMGFRSLRVINDDRVAPSKGFGMHPHRDMEIITYVLSGALEHKDSMGNGRIIRPGEFQYMSAGSGVLHSEFNPSDSETVHLLQIWILPEQGGLDPRYREKKMSDSASGQLHLITSRDGRDDSISIRQDAELWLAKLAAGHVAEHPLAPGRHAWVHVAEGVVEINGHRLSEGDAAVFRDEAVVKLGGVGPAQVLLFDLA